MRPGEFRCQFSGPAAVILGRSGIPLKTENNAKIGKRFDIVGIAPKGGEIAALGVL